MRRAYRLLLGLLAAAVMVHVFTSYSTEDRLAEVKARRPSFSFSSVKRTLPSSPEKGHEGEGGEGGEQRRDGPTGRLLRFNEDDDFYGEEDDTFPVGRRTRQEERDEQADGYLITAQSPHLRERARRACRCEGPSEGWQRAYKRLHRRILDGQRNPQSELKNEEEKYLIFTCRKGQLCGGWGDRMTGVLNVFFFALLTDRVMLIDWELPVPSNLNYAPLSDEQIALINYYVGIDTYWSECGAAASGEAVEEDADERLKMMTEDELREFSSASYVRALNGLKGYVKDRKVGRPQLDRLLEPTNIDWRFRKRRIAHIPKNEILGISSIDGDNGKWKEESITEVDFEADMFRNKKVVLWNSNNWHVPAAVMNERYRQKVIDLFGVDPLSLGDWTAREKWAAELYGCFINFLFRPVPLVRPLVSAQSELMRRRGFTLGVQLRMGGGNVKWNDPERNGLDDVPLFFRCAQDLLYPMSNSTAAVGEPIKDNPVLEEPEDWNVFIITDSDAVKKKLLEQFGSQAMTVDLPITHIDRSKGVSLEGYITIAVETWLLGECDFIVSSRSNLGWFAAKRTLHDFGTYTTDKMCFYDRGLYARHPRFIYQKE